MARRGILSSTNSNFNTDSSNRQQIHSEYGGFLNEECDEIKGVRRENGTPVIEIDLKKDFEALNIRGSTALTIRNSELTNREATTASSLSNEPHDEQISLSINRTNKQTPKPAKLDISDYYSTPASNR